MEPYRYLVKVAETMNSFDSREEITQVLDELEFLYEALEPEFQDMADDLMSQLTARLEALS